MEFPCETLYFYFAEFTCKNTELFKVRTRYNSESNKRISIKFGVKNYSENCLVNLVLVCTNTTHIPRLKFLFQSLQFYSYFR